MDVKNRPKLNFFFQGGVGRPALNILNNGFDPTILPACGLNWSFQDYIPARMTGLLIRK
jgi:hypothetical protein